VNAAGYAGLVVQKAIALGVLWGIWRFYSTVGGLSRDPWRLVVPAVAAVRGAVPPGPGSGFLLVGVHT
jgi:hypothetical protein